MRPAKINLFIIDPQNDFVDPHGSLSVTGAVEDAKRLAKLIEKAGQKISSVTLSLDSHQRLDISHPLWFFNAQGSSPTPFTVITETDLREGTWQVKPDVYEHTLHYLKTLSLQGRYPHVIWPEHCLVGSTGHNIYPLIQEALHLWSERPQRIEYVWKGHNPLTEHFSALSAEVPLADDPSTQVNDKLLAQLQDSDEVWVAGWARSHCVGNTLRDMFQIGGRELAQKTVIITDTMSDVPGFEAIGEAVLKDALDLGARLADVEQLIHM